MDEDTIRRLEKRIKMLLKQRGYHEHVQDASQEILCRYIEKGKGQTVDQAITDYLRRTFGDTRSKHYQLMRDIKWGDKRVDALAAGAMPRIYQQNNDEFEHLLEKIKKSEDRAIIVLSFMWGLTNHEIGYCFGVTESRICQRVKEIQKRVSKALSLDEQRERKQEEFREISLEIQKQFGFQREKSEILGSISEEKGKRMGERTLKIIPKELQRAFRVNTF